MQRSKKLGANLLCPQIKIKLGCVAANGFSSLVLFVFSFTFHTIPSRRCKYFEAKLGPTMSASGHNLQHKMQQTQAINAVYT